MQDTADPLDAALAALQARGAARHATVPWHQAAALARRRLATTGAVRAQLDTRLAALIEVLATRLPADADGTPVAPVGPGPILPASTPGPLAALAAAARPGSAPGDRSPPELKAVQLFGADWARLRIDAQLQRASHQHQQAGPAGPLNSQRLMLQALQTLRQLSPAYLQRWMAQAETLLWLEDTAAPPAMAADRPGRPEAARRRTPARRSTR